MEKNRRRVDGVSIWFAVVMVLLFVACNKAYGKTPASTATKRDVTETLGSLEKGILAVRGHFRHVTPKIAKIIVKEARTVTSMSGNRWLTAAQLIGLAINETDLRWWLRMYTTPKQSIIRKIPPGADCGITQIRVNVYIPRWPTWLNECKRISQFSKPEYSIRESFKWSMRELNKIRNKWCCVRGDKSPTCRIKQVRKEGTERFRCVFNVYNQGPRFAYLWRVRMCKPPQYWWDTPDSRKERVRKCRVKNNYWIRTLCFAEGVKLGRKSRWPCRHAYSLTWIRNAYRRRK